MKTVSRFAVILFVVPATYYFIYWVPFSLVRLNDWIAGLVSLLCALGAGYFVWTKLASERWGVISAIMFGAVLLGGIGFTAGFFGPILFAPDANQGPLLGIFVTGPLGFILGAVLGFMYWMIKCRTIPPSHSNDSGPYNN